MMGSISATFRFELRQALRHKSLWLLVALGLWGTYGFLDATAIPFENRGGWETREIEMTGIAFASFEWVADVFPGIGVAAVVVAVFVTLHLAGRHTPRALSNLVFTKPASTFHLQLGRFLAVGAALSVLSLPPILATLYHYSQHRYYAWQWRDFAILWALGLLWPMWISAAVAWWARNVFRNVLLAGGVSLVLAFILFRWGGASYLSPYWFLANLRGLYHLPLGFYFPNFHLVRNLVGSGLLALSFVAASCFFLRRRLPDRPPAPTGRHRALDTPTLRGLLFSLLPDRYVGADAFASLAICLVGFGVLAASVHFAAPVRGFDCEDWDRVLEQRDREYGPPNPLVARGGDYRGPAVVEGLRIAHYELDLDFFPDQNRLNGQCRMVLANEGPASATHVPFLLNPGLDVQSVEESGIGGESWAAVPYRREFDQLHVSPTKAIPGGATREYRVVYVGSLIAGQSRDRHGRRRYVPKIVTSPVWSLDERQQFYPILAGRPETSDVGSGLRQPFFTASARIKVPGSLHTAVIGAGQRQGERLVATYPLTRLFFVGGPYKEFSQTVKGVTVRMFCLPGREAIARLFLEDIALMLRSTLDYFGGMPYPEIVLYDTVRPVYAARTGPGIIPVDLDPLFRWRTTVDTFNERFNRYMDRRRYFLYVSAGEAKLVQNALIDACFRDAVYPTGRLARLLSDALPRYLKTALHPYSQPNLRLRRHANTFDVSRAEKRHYLRSLNQLLFDAQAPRPIVDNKAVALFHMLRYMTGEDAFQQLLQAYLKQYRFRDVRFADFRRLASETADEDLGWFFNQWVSRPTLPEFVLERAEAAMYDDPKTFGMDYHVAIEVVNEGTGSVRVPVYLKTEGDDIIEHVLMQTGQRREIRIDVPDRPLFASIDPEGWILQSEHKYEKGLVGRVSRKVEIQPYRGKRSEAPPSVKQATE